MKKLTEQEVSVFCAELSMLLSSGMSLEQGIIAMEEEEKTEEVSEETAEAEAEEEKAE